MALIDWFIAAVLVLSVIGAARNGFFIEAFSLAGVVLGLLIASWNFQKLMPWILHAIHTPAVAEAIAFLAIALAIMVMAGLIGRALHWSARSIGLGWLDRLVGALFGFLKGCVVVTLGVMAIAAFLPRNGFGSNTRNSRRIFLVLPLTPLRRSRRLSPRRADSGRSEDYSRRSAGLAETSR